MARHARRSSYPAAVTAACVAATATSAFLAPSARLSADTQPDRPYHPVQPRGTIEWDTVARPVRTAVLTGGYTVQPGDTLSAIAARFCGDPEDYWSLAAANGIADPNRILVGEYIRLACHAAYQAATGTPPAAAPAGAAPAAVVTSFSGSLGCAGLEVLWREAGGAESAEVTAASVAMAESGGNQYALSPTDDYGYWQINASHGPAMATFSALGNAEAAVAISADGTDWSAWTTYTDGAYAGRC
jgi:hypothetical protein